MVCFLAFEKTGAFTREFDAMELPANGSEVTAAWLTQTLRDCNAINTASVTSLTVGVVDHKKGITGHLVRLQIDYDQEEADARIV